MIAEDGRQLVFNRSSRVSNEEVLTSLSQQGETTERQLVHHIDDEAPVGENGPNWEYYLNMLVAPPEQARHCLS